MESIAPTTSERVALLERVAEAAKVYRGLEKRLICERNTRTLMAEVRAARAALDEVLEALP